MAVTLEASADSDDQLLVLIDACRRAPWAAVTRIAVQRKKSDDYPTRAWRIDHVLVEDPEDKKRQVPHPDPTNDIRQIVREVGALGVKLKHRKPWNFIVYGHGTKMVRGKPQIAEDTEIKLFDFPMVLGENDGADEDDDNHDVSAAKVLAQAFKDSIAPFREQAEQHRLEREWLWGVAKESGNANVELQRVRVEVAKVELEARRDERQAQREDRQEAEQREDARDAARWEHDAQVKKSEMLERLGMTALTSPIIAPELARLIRAGADLLESMKRGAGASTAPSDGAPSSPSSDPTSLGQRLDSIFAVPRSKGDDTWKQFAAAMEAAVTIDVWDRLLAASRTTSDQEARAILGPLQERWNPKNADVFGEDGKIDAAKSKRYSADDMNRAHARRDRELNGAADILGPLHMDTLRRVLTDAGIVLKG